MHRFLRLAARLLLMPDGLTLALRLAIQPLGCNDHKATIIDWQDHKVTTPDNIIVLS